MALIDGIVAGYHLNSDVLDFTSNANDGTPTAITYNTTTQKLGSASAIFDGATSVSTIADSTELDLTTDYTIAMWVNHTALSGTYDAFIAKGSGGYAIGALSNGLVYFGHEGVSDISSATSLGTGVWNCIICTHTGGTNYIYIGDPTTADASGAHADATANTNTLVLGKGPSSGYFNGNLDEVVIWNRALSQAERLEFWNGGAGIEINNLQIGNVLSHQYNSSATDVSVNSNNGTPTAITYNTTTNLLGSASAVFDGATSLFTVADDVTLNFGVGAFTVAAWFKKTTNGVAYSLLGKAPDSGSGLWIRLSNADNTLSLLTSSGTFDNLISASTITDTNWHLGIFKRDAAGNKTIKIDNVLDVNTQSDASANVDNASPLLIGSNYAAQLHSGDIDELNIWTRALTTAEDTTLWNGGAGIEVFPAAFNPLLVLTETVNTTGDIINRYYEVLTDVITATSGNAVFSKAHQVTLTDLLTGTDTPTVSLTVPQAYTDSISMTDSLAVAYLLALSEAITALDTNRYIAALVITDSITIQDSIVAGMPSMQFTFTDTVTIKDAMTAAAALLLQENISISDSAPLSPLRIIEIAETLTVEGVINTSHNAIFVVASVANFLDEIRPALSDHSITLTEAVTILDGFVAQVLKTIQLADSVAMSSVTDSTLQVLIPLESNVTVTGENIANTISQMILTENVAMGISFLHGGEVYQGLCMNSKTFSVSEYAEYPFNSFCFFEKKYFGANSLGIYLLDGNDDDGAFINSKVRTGLSDFGSTNLKRIKEAFLGFRADGNMVLKTVTDDGIERWYEVINNVSGLLDNKRLKLPLGIRSRYWQFELANIDGADFKVDNLEMLPILLQGRW